MAIRQAVNEFDLIGREAFLTGYGFRKARRYFLEVDGKLYDSKAVIAAAHGYQYPNRGPLVYDDFSGGEKTVQRKLEELGFHVKVLGPASDDEVSPYTSERLTVGHIYAREHLAATFGITDATLNTGVFRPAGTNSIWLFVTKDKTQDRTQYQDRLEENRLYWQGQTSGRTDAMIVAHESRDLELLLFYRERKYQHPKAAFRFEGRFRYVSHSGAKPSNFVLERIGGRIEASAQIAWETEPFDPTSVEDGRARIMGMVTRRQGQEAFRKTLLKAYGWRCAVTGCTVEAVLEAAHIHPYLGPTTNHITNGLLVRADIHTLFDLGLLAVDAQHRLLVSPELDGTAYGKLNGKALRQPRSEADRPSAAALQWHRQQHGFEV
ncbi:MULTISPECIES: HNH endonuclease [unclassified Azospirillum]|uniref:HNH endonuclease n=1 Tax=unclassified Azospirillum TaxID=2630922 RepID=UPI0013049657|nr:MULTISPECIES: HNH endonuclease [unclassified Azospirillum]